MFERFTERARQVVVLAQQEAQTLKHNYIGTEHLLLGLLREEEGLAAQVLQSLDITLERVRAQVVRVVGAGEEITSGQIPFTPRAKKVLELALREALSLGHNYIGTEHVLLGLARENEGVAARILLDFDADSETIRNEVVLMLSGAGSHRRTAGERPSPTAEDVWLDGLAPLLGQLAREIRDKLGREPDDGDLLLALACARETLPGRVLGELGIDLDVLWGRIERARAQVREAEAQAVRAREELARQIRDVQLAKEEAIAAQQFERAAALRDQERELLEQSQPGNAGAPELLQEITRRLGIPQTDGPPPSASSSSP